MSFIPLPQDPSSQGVLVIDSAHHEIHEGDSFRYNDAITLGSGVSQDYLITTPNTTKWAHLIYDIDGTAITSFTFFEGADRAGTTLQTVWNANRNSANPNTTTVHKGTSGGTTDGVSTMTYASGTATNQSRSPSAFSNFGFEIILKQNTKYVLRVTSGTAGNLCNVSLRWYEHVSGE